MERGKRGGKRSCELSGAEPRGDADASGARNAFPGLCSPVRPEPGAELRRDRGAESAEERSGRNAAPGAGAALWSSFVGAR